MDYKFEYYLSLNDKRWKAKSHSIKERDNFTCNICHNKTGALCVHHTNYTTLPDEPWNEDDWNLITLCVDCHEWVHSFQDATGISFYEDEWMG